MKRSLFFVLLIATLAVPLAGQTIKVVSWNIAYGKNYDTIHRSLAELNADIVLLQEADRYTKRVEKGTVDVANELAVDLGLQVTWKQEFRELKQGPEAFTGQAVLSSTTVSSTSEEFNYQPANWSKSSFAGGFGFLPGGQPREGGRMVQIATLDIDGQTLIIANTHLESRANDKKRAQQAEEILALDPLPDLITGDLNTHKGINSPVLKLFKEHGYQVIDPGVTTPKGETLDWILVRDGIEIENLGAQVYPGSDHYPVVATLTIH